MNHSYYQAPIEGFLRVDGDTILGELTRAHGFALEQPQRDAWLAQIAVLKDALAEHRLGQILFEFAIPRMGKRADVVVWSAHPFSVYSRADLVFVDGALRWDADRPQVWSDLLTGQELVEPRGTKPAEVTP